MVSTVSDSPTPDLLTKLVQRLHALGGSLSDEERAAIEVLLASAGGPAPLPRPLLEEEFSAFRTDGVVLVRSVAPEWAHLARSATQRLLDCPSPFLIDRSSEPGGPRSMRDDCAWQREPALEAYVRWSAAATLARMLLGDDGVLVLTGVSVFGKEPGAGLGSPWHHDRPRPPAPDDRICNLWMALDDGTPQSGTVQVIRGSHRWDPARLAKLCRRDSMDERSPGGIPGLVIPDDEVMEMASFSVAAGDIVCFDGRAVHGAAGNCSPAPFRALTTFWWVGDQAWVDRRRVEDSPCHGG